MPDSFDFIKAADDTMFGSGQLVDNGDYCFSVGGKGEIAFEYRLIV